MKPIFKLMFGGQVKKWLRERLLHVPESEVDDLARKIGITRLEFRAVESMLADRADAQWERF